MQADKSARLILVCENSVYMRPYNAKRLMVCIDEKSKELRSEVRKPIRMPVGKEKPQDSAYKRENTANLFMSVETLGG